MRNIGFFFVIIFWILESKKPLIWFKKFWKIFDVDFLLKREFPHKSFSFLNKYCSIKHPQAVDGIRNCTNYTQVLIMVTDANDNVPKFALPKYRVQIREDQQIHIPFFAVHAMDRDQSEVGCGRRFFIERLANIFHSFWKKNSIGNVVVIIKNKVYL